jgi:hypothetical protein
MNENENQVNPERIVGISGVKMENSSITDSTIVSSNPNSGKTGIFDIEMRNSNISKIIISDEIPQLTLTAQNELKSFGLDEVDINKLNEIIKESNIDKPTMSSRILKWLGSVSTSIVATGIYENFPELVKFTTEIISTLFPQ